MTTRGEAVNASFDVNVSLISPVGSVTLVCLVVSVEADILDGGFTSELDVH